MESEAFARWLEDRRMGGRDLCFVIGGPYGLELPHVEHRLSFGKLTLPYQLARVVLLEQLYRGAQDPRRRALPLLMGELELRHFARRIGLLFALIAGLLVFGTSGSR